MPAWYRWPGRTSRKMGPTYAGEAPHHHSGRQRVAGTSAPFPRGVHGRRGYGENGSEPGVVTLQYGGYVQAGSMPTSTPGPR